MCNKVVSKEHFILRFCLDKYKTQEMCDKAVNACPWPPAIKSFPDWMKCLKDLMLLYSLMMI